MFLLQDGTHFEFEKIELPEHVPVSHVNITSCLKEELIFNLTVTAVFSSLTRIGWNQC